MARFSAMDCEACTQLPIGLSLVSERGHVISVIRSGGATVTRRRLAIYTAIVAIIACQGAHPPAQTSAATTGLDDSTSTAVDQPDLAYVAESSGWTAAEAADSAHAAEIVGNIAREIASTRPSAFVGSAVGAKPGEPPTIYIKGPADPYIRNLVASAAIRILIADNQPYSREELEQRKHAIHQLLTEIGYDDLMTSYDIQNRGRIHVVLSRRNGLPDLASDVLAQLPEDLRSDVEIEMVSRRVDEPQAAYGGMYGTKDGNNWCLFAWSVRSQASGITGLVTASVAHCGVMTGVRVPGIGIYGASVQYPDHWGYWGEYAWYTTTTTEPAKFYADSSEVRVVQSVEHWAELSVNEWVCIFSRVRDQRPCGQVKSPSIACSDMDHVVQMKSNMTVNGDSGGGWSYNYRAFGIHHGLCDSLSAYSLAYYLPYGLAADDVVVRTQ